MRTAAIIITGLAVSMAIDGETAALPFWLAVALALELKHRARAREPRPSPDETPTDSFEAVRPWKRGRHG